MRRHEAPLPPENPRLLGFSHFWGVKFPENTRLGQFRAEAGRFDESSTLTCDGPLPALDAQKTFTRESFCLPQPPFWATGHAPHHGTPHLHRRVAPSRTRPGTVTCPAIAADIGSGWPPALPVLKGDPKADSSAGVPVAHCCWATAPPCPYRASQRVLPMAAEPSGLPRWRRAPGSWQMGKSMSNAFDTHAHLSGFSACPLSKLPRNLGYLKGGFSAALDPAPSSRATVRPPIEVVPKCGPAEQSCRKAAAFATYEACYSATANAYPQWPSTVAGSIYWAVSPALLPTPAQCFVACMSNAFDTHFGPLDLPGWLDSARQSQSQSTGSAAFNRNPDKRPLDLFFRRRSHTSQKTFTRESFFEQACSERAMATKNLGNGANQAPIQEGSDMPPQK